MNGWRVAAFLLSAGAGFASATLAASAKADLDSVPGALPKTIVPVLYDIDIVPDLTTMKIRGRETVTIEVRRSTRRVVLNALQTTVSAATVDGVAASSIVTGPQTLTMTFAKALAPGVHALRIAYVATVQTSPQGLFVQKYADQATGKSERLIGTQRVDGCAANVSGLGRADFSRALSSDGDRVERVVRRFEHADLENGLATRRLAARQLRDVSVDAVVSARVLRGRFRPVGRVRGCDQDSRVWAARNGRGAHVRARFARAPRSLFRIVLRRPVPVAEDRSHFDPAILRRSDGELGRHDV
jgi:hypothetical protein